MLFDPNSLKPFLTPGPERVGFILKDLSVVEVNNICQDPENGFEVDTDDLMKYEDDIVATWHTHPGEGQTSNLSVADYLSFQNYPEWRHLIIGCDGISMFEVVNGKVLCADGSISTDS